MSDLKEGVDYSFVLGNKEGESYYVFLTSGDFSGVKYKYEQVSFEEDQEKEEVFLKFGYTIIERNDIENLEENLEFKNHIGDILINVLEKNSKTEG